MADLKADHVETNDNLMHHPLEEALRRRHDLLALVGLQLEKPYRLLEMILRDIRREIVVEALSVCLGLDLDRHLALRTNGAIGRDLTLGGEVNGAQVGRSCLQHHPDLTVILGHMFELGAGRKAIVIDTIGHAMEQEPGFQVCPCPPSPALPKVDEPSI